MISQDLFGGNQIPVPPRGRPIIDGPQGGASAAIWGGGFLCVVIVAALFCRGKVGGDEGAVLRLVRHFHEGDQSFWRFVVLPENAYAYHHVLWFWLLYGADALVRLLRLGPLAAEAALSAVTVAAATLAWAAGAMFLIRRMAMPVRNVVWLVLALGGGGTGAYLLVAGGAVENFMALAVMARLFFANGPRSPRSGLGLAAFDAILIVLKPYMAIYLGAMFFLGLCRSDRRWLVSYLPVMTVALGGLAAFKIGFYNPPDFYHVGRLSVVEYSSRLAGQYISWSTGIIFCQPIIMVLLLLPRRRWPEFVVKVTAIFGCSCVFALYAFADGGTPGGRYIFPILLDLLPELALSTAVLLRQWRQSAWILPLLLVIFLPADELRLGYAVDVAARPPVSTNSCLTDHPAVFAWKVVLARMTTTYEITVCRDAQEYRLEAVKVPPMLMLSRVHYLLSDHILPEYKPAAAALWNLGLRPGPFWSAIWMLPWALLLAAGLVAAHRCASHRLPAPTD